MIIYVCVLAFWLFTQWAMWCADDQWRWMTTSGKVFAILVTVTGGALLLGATYITIESERVSKMKSAERQQIIHEFDAKCRAENKLVVIDVMTAHRLCVKGE